MTMRGCLHKYSGIIQLQLIVEMSKYRGDQTAQQTLSYIEKILAVELEKDEYEERLYESLSLSYSYLMQKKLDWSIDLENLSKKFIDLAFETNMHSYIKEVLKSYRAITQNQHPQSLKGVLEYYRDKKLEEILEDETLSSQLAFIREMPDIETDEASSEIIFSSFQSENKNEREDIKSKLKLVWDGYKAIIDTVRVNHKLEAVYRNTLKKIFDFVDHYNRKHEFKLLCKYLRDGLKIAINKRDRTEQQKGFYIDIEKDEVNTNNIEIRLEQFKVTIKLGLWQEAFQILEDINELMKIRKGPLKSQIKSLYFYNLAVLFKKSNYWHYHAYAFFNYYAYYLNKPKITTEEKRKISDKLILSVLCIPPSTLESNQSKESQDKIGSMMISSTKIPNKKELEEIMVSRGVVENASQEIKDLWYFMFLEFDMTSLQKGLALLKKIDDHDEFIDLLENIFIFKQLISIAQVYQRIKYDHLLSLIPLPKEKIEKILLQSYHQQIIKFILDEKEGIVIFEDKSEESNPYEELHSSFIDLALKREEIRPVDSKFIIEKTMNFMETADDYYWKIRQYKIDEYTKKLKQPMKENQLKKRKKEKQEREQREREEALRRQREEEARKEAEERRRNFIKKKVIIEDIIKIKEKRIVRISIEGEKKKIQDTTDEDIEITDIVTFERLLDTTKAKVLSDTENRFKKKFNMLNYFERERRELLDPIISEEVKRGQEEKRIETIEVSKQSFEEDQMLKAKIQEIGPEVKEKITDHYNRAYEQYQKELSEYKSTLKDLYQNNIISRAKALRQEEKKKREEAEKRRNDLETKNQSELWNFKGGARAGQKTFEKGKQEEEKGWFKKEQKKQQSKDDYKWTRKTDVDKVEEKKPQKAEKREANIRIGAKFNPYSQLVEKDDEEEEVKAKKPDSWNMKKREDLEKQKQTQQKQTSKTNANEAWIGKKSDKKNESTESGSKFQAPKAVPKKGKAW